MDKDKIGLVVKSNKLVEASYRLDLIEQRIILAAIVEARESQKGLENGFITLEAKRFCQTFGMEEEKAQKVGAANAQENQCLDRKRREDKSERDHRPEIGHETRRQDGLAILRGIESELQHHGIDDGNRRSGHPSQEV